MSKDSTSRKKKILNIIVREYINSATPVASENLQRNYVLGVSSATIRNDMACLEEEGYITRPHTSAGCIPLNKGYRHYVESISANAELPLEEQQRIRNMFLEAAEQVDKWLKLAVSLMSRLVGNAAVVTYPRAIDTKFKHIELVSLHDFLGLAILILSEAHIKQHLLTFNELVNQDRLTGISNKLNANYSGLGRPAILAKKLDLNAMENQVLDLILEMMAAEETADIEETYLEGLRLMLNQPEFTQQERMLRVLEIVEAKDWLRSLIREHLEGVGVNVVIGEESGNESLKDFSLVFGRYGIPERLGGTVGIIGPTRMDYQRAISSVGYISGILSYLMDEVYFRE